MTEFRDSELCMYRVWNGVKVSGSLEQMGRSSYERERSEAGFPAVEYPSPGHMLTCPAFGLLESRAVFSLHLLIPLSLGSPTEGGFRQYLMDALEGTSYPTKGLMFLFSAFPSRQGRKIKLLLLWPFLSGGEEQWHWAEGVLTHVALRVK